MDFYELVRGPFAWVAFIIFVAGCLFRIISRLISGKKEPALYPSTSFKDAIRESSVSGGIRFHIGFAIHHGTEDNAQLV